jgi:16S rRNA (cytosine967-C5)-methyltransferase
LADVVPGTPARVAALQTLRRVRAGGRFDAALDEAARNLSNADRRLAHEISAGVLRARDQLDRTVRPLTTVRWSRLDPDVRDLLHIGTYQIRHLDRIPAHAALSATVEAAKREVGTRPAGLVNAVLRRVARGEPAEQTTPHDAATQHSHPRWLVERWRETFGGERTEGLLAHNNARPPLTLRPTRWSAAELARALEEARIAHRPGPFPPTLIVEASPVTALPGYADGAFVVQDAAQSRLLGYAEIPERARVWDACAAPGGKSAVLASSGRRVIASDRNRRRVPVLRRTLARVAPRTPVLVADASRPPFQPGSMDAVLVDAPCSATGTMARHPDARWRLSPGRIRRLVALQRAILDGVAGVVARDGLLVYLTCSLEPEENGRQIDHFLTRHPGFCRATADLSIFPTDAGTDGGFGARMRRIS